MIPASTLATYEAANRQLSKVFERLRADTPGKPLEDLKRWSEVLSGWLPTIGELASECGAQARQAKVAAESRRASIYAGGLVKDLPQREAEAIAKADESVLDGLKDWAEMKGWADKLYTLRDDCVESLNGVKKSIEAEKIMRGV